MNLDDRKRKLIRLAYQTKDSDLRRRALDRLRPALDDFLDRRDTMGPDFTSTLEDDTELDLYRVKLATPFARRMVRVAYTTKDPVLRRGILESIRVAAYPKDFLEAVKQQKFHNPNTGNKVKFVSLPGVEQAQIYNQWKQKQQDEETGLEKVSPNPETMNSAAETIHAFLPERVDSLEEAKKKHEAGESWRMSAVGASKYAGKYKFWEVRGDGDKIEIRFGGNYEGAGKPQVKEFKGTVDQAWKRFQQKLDKGYDSGIGPNWAMSFSGGPMKMDADKVWEGLEKKHGDNPKEMAGAVKAALQSLTQLDAWSPGNWDNVHETSDGLVDKWKEYQAKGGKTEKKDKPKGPEMVDMTGDIMQKLQDISKDYKEHATKKTKAPKKKPKKKPKVPPLANANKEELAAVRESLGGAGAPGTNIWNILEDLETGKSKHLTPTYLQGAITELSGKAKGPSGDAVKSTIKALRDLKKTLSSKSKTKKPEKKPEKTEAPKGKHKDRKELRAKPKKKMPDPVKVSDELAKLVIPEGMKGPTKEQAKKQLESANYQLLATLRENAQHAIDDPKGAYAKALAKAGYTPDGIKKMHTALSKTLEPALGRKYHPDVLQVANKHDLESEDADNLADFKGDKPARGKKLSPQELFNRFMAKAKPETKKRMQGMPLDDFMVMYKSIMADEDEDEGEIGKTANRLPQEPYTVMQDALEEETLAEDEDDENTDVLAGEDEDAGGASIFDAPTTVKRARLSTEDRCLVRIAHDTANPHLRRRLLGILRENVR